MIGRSACAAVLSCVLVLGPALDGARAWAVDTATAETSGGGASQLDSAAAGGEGEPEGSQRSEIVELSEASEGASGRETAPAAPGNVGQATAEAPLSHDEPRPVAGEVRVDGFVYSVNPDGASVALVGWYGDAPTGDVSVPARIAVGETSFAVVALGDSSGEGLFADAPVASLSIPALVDAVADGALSGCPTLSRVSVSSENQTYASFDGMLFSKDLSDLLLVPEGKEGVARIPDPATSVPAGAFSRAPGLCEAVVGEGSAAFSSRDGLLYTKDMNTLVACPPGAGGAVVLPEGVESIASGAFAGCALTSITALGFVRDIAADAFDAEARSGAVVALPAGDDYEARKAVWKAAGFESFKEPAKPGDVAVPEPSEPEAPQASGLAYEVLGDYTLAVSWQGARGPEGTLEIPATAEVGGVSYRVSAISDAAFAGRSGLTGVALPASVAVVGDRAFEATGLVEAWLPASVATVGERAFAACASLERVVALGSPWVADSALAECAGVSVYAPSDSDSPWNVGLPAAGNHLMPYGVALPEEPLALEVGQSASILEGGQLEAPDPVETSYSYAAKPLSVDPDGTATGKAEGSSEVTVALAIEGVELARATRSVEVAAVPEPEAPAVEPEVLEDSQVQAPSSEPEVLSQTVSLASTAAKEERAIDRDSVDPLSMAALLTTGSSFEKTVGTGQTLAFDVVSEDEQSKTGTVSVSKGDVEPVGALTVPAVVEHGGITYDVVAVGARGFFECNALMSVSFEGDKMKSFGESSFDGCRGMLGIALPESLESLGRRSFANCGSLINVSIPDSVRTFGEYLFLDSSSLSEVTLGTGYRSASAGDFAGCGRLSRIVVEGEVASFASSSFNYVPTESVEVLVSSDQARTAWLESSRAAGIAFSDSRVRVAGEMWTVTFEANGGTPAVFTKAVPKGESLGSTTVPWKNGFGFAGWYADEACTSAWTATDPVMEDMTLYAEWVQEARDGGFVYRMREDGTSLSVSAENASGLRGAVAIPGGKDMGGTVYPVAEIASNAFSGASGLTSIEIPDSIREIGSTAFKGCASLATVVIGDASELEVVGFDSFSGCTSLESVRLPSLVESIEPGAFYGCSELATADLSACANLKTIKSAAFSDCASLESVMLPDTLEAIEKNVFYRCASLDSIVLPSALKTIGTRAFFECANLSQGIEVPSGVEFMFDSTFQGCSALPSVDLPGVKKIGEQAFGSCTSLESVSMPSVSSIAPLAFKGDVSLASVSLPDTLTSIGQDAFNGSGLRSVEIPSSVRSLSMGAFSKCADLKTATVDARVEAVPAWLFSECTGLVSVLLDDGIAEIKTSAFGSCSALSSISLPLSLTTVASNAFEGCESLSAVRAEGSMRSVDIASVFSDDVKSKATVALPPTSRDGSGEGFETMSEVWKSKHGFSKVICTEGALPLESDAPGSPNADPAKAGWSLDENGVLSIWSTEKLADFQWRHTGSEFREQYWGPVRSLVKSVDTTGVHSAYSLWAWFRNMPNLTDISKFAVPAETVEVIDVFTSDEALTEIPAIAFPDSVTSVWACFNACTSVERIADDFVLPPNLIQARHLFAENTSLAELPAAFILPDTVTDAYGLFEGSTSLARLPQGFALPRDIEDATRMFMGCFSLGEVPDGIFAKSGSVKLASRMFEGCAALSSLPNGFEVPTTVTDARWMFQNCTSLASLPAGFSVSAGCNVTSMFAIEADRLVDGQKLSTYYAGSGLAGYDWAASNRTLVAPSAKPANAKEITLNVKADGEAGPGSYWTTAYTDGSGVMAEPSYAPSRPGMVFTLWYADEACTQRVDFSQPFSADATLYGKLVFGTLGGALPTEAGTGSAFWSLADDGALYIRGAGTIADLGWPTNGRYGNAVPETGHWSPYRADVRKAVMQPGMRALSTFEWFSGMEDLVDVEGVYIPAGTKDTAKMFFGASSLASLPASFNVPSGVGDLSRMFGYCSALQKLPEGFSLPDSAYATNAMFIYSALVALPESMTIPKGLSNPRYMFDGCSELVSLPSGFVFPEGSIADAGSMFKNCVKLASLPEGFTIRSTMRKGTNKTPIENMFYNCYALATLPDGFDIPAEFAGSTDTFKCELEPGAARVNTFYGGSSNTVLNYDWESDGRTLVTDPADMGEWGMRRVKLQVQSPDEAAGFPWETRTVAWTDKQGVLADPGQPQLGGYAFSGWCVDEECLESADFAKPLPEGVDTLYGKWVKHGGRGTVEGQEGWLPVESPDGALAASGMSAWWSITADGALNIKCEGGGSVAALGMSWNDDCTKYWEPYADDVRSLNMHDDVKARYMASWFKRMTKLEDIRQGFFIPDNCQDVSLAFFSCTSLRALPEGFFPATNDVLVGVAGLFQNCGALTELPADFILPESVTSTAFLLYSTGVEALPEKFVLPSSLTTMNQMFRYCRNLRSLPESLVVPKETYVLTEAFADCPNLTVLPQGLLDEISDDRAKASINEGRGMFGFASGTVHDKPLATYFPAADDRKQLVDWANQDRSVVESAPDGKCFVKLMLSSETPGYYQWKLEMATIGSTIDAPAAPARVGSAFVGWFTDPNLNTPATFPLDVAGDIALYAKYVATSGPLPTVGGEDDASWELAQDGTLSIRAGSSPIADFGWGESLGGGSSQHWGALRSKVSKIAMDRDVTVESEMDGWFQGMANLIDVGEFRIPDGVASVRSLFNGCSSLESLPSGFTLPEGVTDAYRLFDWCTSLRSLPESFSLPSTLEDAYALLADCPELESLPSGFQLPDGLKNVQSMFYGDSKLWSLPEGFSLPSSVDALSYMFYGCERLESLPQGFAIPASIVATSFDSMFYGCSSLGSLPEGFDVPESATAVREMFFGCTSLRSLPASLDLSKLTHATGVSSMFHVGEGFSGTLPTYFAGADASLLAPPGTADVAYYWKESYRRELSAGAPPAGTHAVTFMLQRTGEAAPSAWQTVLVDEGAALQRPADPYAFGYRFGGWKLRGADGSLADYDFGAPVASDLVLAGTLAMEVDVDVPLQAKATVDAAGAWSPGEVEFRSLTPATVRVAGVSGELAPHAGELFPSGAEKVGVKATFGRASGAVVPGSPDPAERSVGLSASLAPAAPGAPSLLPCSIAVEPNGAQVSYQPGDGMTSFARLSWTIEVAVP